MRGDVILVPFPFEDLTGSKVRPAVCLTDSIGVHRHIVIAFISSVVPAVSEPSDLLIDPSDPAFTRTGLRVRSVVRFPPRSHNLISDHSAEARRVVADIAHPTGSKTSRPL